MIEIPFQIWPPDDFVEYWAAGRLNVEGADPYHPDGLLPLERSAGRDTDEAIMMWNPPCALSMAMPFGLLPPRVAQLLWFAMHLAMVLWSVTKLWVIYGRKAGVRAVSWVIGLAFLPTVFVLQAGQISAALLFGFVAMLHFLKTDRPGLAGACLILPALKPHLFVAVWPVIGVWAILTGRWRFLLGSITALVITTAIPVLFNPQVLTQYWDAMANRPPAQWVSPTFGTLLRMAFGEGRFGLQFWPMLMALGWMAIYAWRNRHAWTWDRHLPALALVSLAFAPYGAWPFDMVVLLLPIIQIAASVSGRNAVIAAGAFLAFEAAALTLNANGAASFWFIWMAPVTLLCHALWMSHGGDRS